MPTTFSEDVSIRRKLDLSAATSVETRAGLFPRTSIVEDALAEIAMPITEWSTWDNLSARLATAPGSDDLGIVEGTYGTHAPTMRTSDAASTTVTQYGRLQFALPPNYISGQDVQIVIRAKMNTVSDTTAVLDIECYKHDDDGAVGSDLCSTAAQSINTATFADYTFVITETGLAPGDILDIRLTVAITDSATGSGVIAYITKTSIKLDLR